VAAFVRFVSDPAPIPPARSASASTRREPRPPAILLGGGPIALTVARSLAGIGVAVTALGYRHDPVRYSRACRSFTDLGAGDGVQDRWFEWLRTEAMEGAIVLPCNDDALELLARRREEIVGTGYRPLPAKPDVILAMLDKHATYELADRVGVPTPRTVLVRAGDGNAGLDGIPFPCALKPRRSHDFMHHFPGTTRKVLLAHDEAQLAAHMRTATELGLDMLVTEIVPGPEDAYHSFYGHLDDEGRALVHLTKRKLRQFPPGFGLATYHQVTQEPEVAEMGLRFLRGVGMRGLGVVEFKRDPRDGVLKLIECNHRFTLGTEIVRRAGVDLGLVAYLDAVGTPPEPITSYRPGVREWSPLNDTRACLALRAAGELSAAQWVRSVLHRQHFQLWSWRDPYPSVRRAARRVRGAIARVR
jgi:predicted ATP-grasp superfamily ATP-dependent carboligase